MQDDVDNLPTILPLTPAFAREVIAQKGQAFSGALVFGIKTKGGAATVPAVEREVTALIPAGVIATDHALIPVVAKADRALKPISIALGVFGGIALLAALLIAAQLIARRCRLDRDELGVLRALGASPSETVLDTLIGFEVSIIVGSLLAAAVAVALSPLAPLGPVRPVDPSRGISFDWTVLGLGVVVLVVLLSAVAALLAFSTAPHRTALRPRIRSTAGARVVASRRGPASLLPASSGCAWPSSPERAAAPSPCAPRCSGPFLPWHSS